MANRWGNNGNSDRQFLGAPKSLWMVMGAMKLKDIYLLLERKAMTNLDSKKQTHYFADKGLSS